jgi:peroxidase
MLIGAHGSTTLLDLGAINIERGRDVGLPYLNAMREELGLDRYDSFEALTSDVGTREALRQVYGGDIDKVELWVGGLAEDHVNGGLLGETFHRIVEDEFLRIREADPAYWENQDWSPEEHDLIAGTTMSDIILHNTGIRSIQDNPFMAAERRDFGDTPEHPELPQLIISKGPGVLEHHHSQTDEMLA